MDVEDEVLKVLEHHGIKGQRWGVRRSKSERSSSRTSLDFRKAQELRKRNPSTLSNKQLKTLNERLQLERTHKNLNPGIIHSGKARVEFILGTVSVGATAFRLLPKGVREKTINSGKKFVNKVMSGWIP